MKAEVLSYSMTGNTARVCKAVAARLGADHHALRTPLAGSGFWGMMRLGLATVMGRRTAVDVVDAGLAGADVAVLGAPVWAWRLSIPMRSYLEARPALPGRVALVLTSGSPDYPEKVFAEFARLTGREPVATLHVSEAEAKAGGFDAKVAEFCGKIAPGSA